MIMSDEQVRSVLISEIKIPAWHREPIKEHVESLAASIKEVGLIHPVTLSTELVLGAGRNRLEAFRLLGQDRIDAFVKPFTEGDLEIASIDENIIRRNLSAAQEAVAIKRRKELWEEKHGKSDNIAEFIDDTQKSTGRSRTRIREDLEFAEKLEERIPEDVQELVNQTSIRDRREQLKELVNYDAETQKEIMEAIRDFEIADAERRSKSTNKRDRESPKTLSIAEAHQQISGEVKYNDTGTAQWSKAIGKTEKIVHELLNKGVLKAVLTVWTEDAKLDARDSLLNLRDDVQKAIDLISEDLDGRYH